MTAPLVTPLLLAFLTATPITGQPATEERDGVGVRHLELTAEGTGQNHAVRISPHRTTTFVLHTPLQRDGVSVEEREHFLSVTVDEAVGVVTLLPSSSLPPGRELLLTMRFADGAAPEGATVRLVVHPLQAEQQVDVSRRPRSGEACEQAVQRERERAERCEVELARTQAEGRPPEGLVDLFAAGLVGRGHGLAVRDITEDLTQHPSEVLAVRQAWSYRAHRGKRVVVELYVNNTGTQAWTAEGARLVGPEGVRPRVLRVWQPGPLSPQAQDRVVVEAEATSEQARGPFLLEVSAADGTGILTVRGVNFP
ncbi:DUF2381 family protein [Archangium violaceum]|uniref:DUF2381 family protein n=1 Tax=Archangium violaceum TaxID=83451 RepID=UPI00193BA2E8|nr:DUF2381 family protein [Archangium violaceum]QRK12199.1 DUF2381 family protein [Archangium violaceum]